MSVLARDAKERENADTITVNIFNDPKAPNSIKIDSISYNYANRKLQIYLPVTTTDFEYFRMITDDGNTTDTLSYKIFENNGKHARAAISSNSLPLGAAVEIEAIFEI